MLCWQTSASSTPRSRRLAWRGESCLTLRRNACTQDPSRLQPACSAHSLAATSLNMWHVSKQTLHFQHMLPATLASWPATAMVLVFVSFCAPRPARTANQGHACEPRCLCCSFCWGGLYAVLLAQGQNPKVSAAVVYHGSLITPADVEAVTAPINFQQSDPALDRNFNTELYNQVTAEQGHFSAALQPVFLPLTVIALGHCIGIGRAQHCRRMLKNWMYGHTPCTPMQLPKGHSHPLACALHMRCAAVL